MTTLEELRAQAKKLGLKGYSRLTKGELIAAVTTVEVHRGDLRAMRKLGLPYLSTCKVGRWTNKGTSRKPFWYPLSWLVPAFVLTRQGITPIVQEEAEANRAKISGTAKASYRDRYSRACDLIGAVHGSRTAHALVRGQIDADLAELRAYKAEYRHEHTDYDDLIRESGDRDDAREAMQPTSPIPDAWPDWLDRYGFTGDVVEALAQTLKDPRHCHPVWFKEAEIAVRRAGVGLDELTYEKIRAAIAYWREQRTYE